MTIALGIGATTAIFAVVDGVVLRPLPYPDPDRLVRLLRTPDPDDTDAVAWPDFRDWREQANGFEGLTAYAEDSGALEWESGAQVVTGSRVTRDFFEVMGVPLAMGRTFTEEEDQPGGPDAIVISHRLWVSRFDADPAVIGRTVPQAGSNVPVVVVAAAGFSAPFEDTRYWTPMQGDQLLADVGLPTGGRSLSFQNVIGRLGPGVDLVVVEEGLRALARRIDESVGKREPQWSNVALVPLDEWLVGDVESTLLFLLAAAALVLVVARANVAGLALSRSSVRSRELAVRRAIGAGRGRLLRQLLTESALLCGVAGIVGLLLAWLLRSTLVGLAPEGLPRAEDVGITSTTFLFALGATLVSGIVVGLLPSWHASRSELSLGLGGGRGSSGGRRALRPQQFRVSFQVAVAVVLLTGAALLTGSFARLLGVDRGFESNAVLVATVAPSEARYESAEELSGFYASLLARVSALPGVSHASTTYSPPLFGNDFRTSITPEGVEEVSDDRSWVGTVVIGDDYFHTNGMPLLRGREFGPDDGLGKPLVAIVSETMADRHWPGEDPLGKRFEFTGGSGGARTLSTARSFLTSR